MSAATLTSTFPVPILPNTPLREITNEGVLGTISLRKNTQNNLIENVSFDTAAITYDSDYQNNQAGSTAFTQHMSEVLDILKATVGEKATVVEVGCGKGNFLELVQEKSIFEIKGYDAVYEGTNPNIHQRYLTHSDRISADLVILRHVLEHIQEPHKFLHLLAKIFGDTPIYIEVPDYEWIIKNQTFFDLTYEHVNYFDPDALSNLFKTTAQSGPLFGNQYQYVIANLRELNYQEYHSQYAQDENWQPAHFDTLFPNFAASLDKIEMESAGQPIHIWGAATKGVMFAHHVKRTHPTLFKQFSHAVDVNPLKVGKYMPSSHLPIVDAASFVEKSQGAEFIIIMNPNYEAEILSYLKALDYKDPQYLSI